MIRTQIEEITQQKIEARPETFLLGIVNGQYEKETTYLIIHMITAA